KNFCFSYKFPGFPPLSQGFPLLGSRYPDCGSTDSAWDSPGKTPSGVSQGRQLYQNSLWSGYIPVLYIPSWKVREITSSCCSFVSLWKFTAYPDTRTVSCGYFSGCF